jgi:hypothetical protein
MMIKHVIFWAFAAARGQARHVTIKLRVGLARLVNERAAPCPG